MMLLPLSGNLVNTSFTAEQIRDVKSLGVTWGSHFKSKFFPCCQITMAVHSMRNKQGEAFSAVNIQTYSFVLSRVTCRARRGGKWRNLIGESQLSIMFNMNLFIWLFKAVPILDLWSDIWTFSPLGSVFGEMLPVYLSVFFLLLFVFLLHVYVCTVWERCNL